MSTAIAYVLLGLAAVASCAVVVFGDDYIRPLLKAHRDAEELFVDPPPHIDIEEADCG